MSDPKYDKALRTILSLKKLAEHPSTGEGERTAALGRIEALKAKWNISTAQPKPPPTRTDRTGGFNSTGQNHAGGYDANYWASWFNDHRSEKAKTDEEAMARRIKKEQAEYQAWKAANDRAMKARAEKARMDKLRKEAQTRWEQRNQARNAQGEQLTDEEKREAQRDPLGWASKRDGRTTADKNAEMNDARRYGHTDPYMRREEAERKYRESGPNNCSTPLSFFTSGGEARKRNVYPTYCHECGRNLPIGEGAIWRVGSKWLAACCETIPGPRKKKQGRG